MQKIWRCKNEISKSGSHFPLCGARQLVYSLGCQVGMRRGGKRPVSTRSDVQTRRTKGATDDTETKPNARKDRTQALTE